MPDAMLTDFSDPKPSDSLSEPLAALWWLKKGDLKMGPAWEAAHALCQRREGTFEYDIVHALAHWIEGDAANASYWYRRARTERAATIAAEWERVVTLLTGRS